MHKVIGDPQDEMTCVYQQVHVQRVSDDVDRKVLRVHEHYVVIRMVVAIRHEVAIQLVVVVEVVVVQQCVVPQIS